MALPAGNPAAAGALMNTARLYSLRWHARRPSMRPACALPVCDSCLPVCNVPTLPTLIKNSASCVFRPSFLRASSTLEDVVCRSSTAFDSSTYRECMHGV